MKYLQVVCDGWKNHCWQQVAVQIHLCFHRDLQIHELPHFTGHAGLSTAGSGMFAAMNPCLHPMSLEHLVSGMDSQATGSLFLEFPFLSSSSFESGEGQSNPRPAVSTCVDICLPCHRYDLSAPECTQSHF